MPNTKNYSTRLRVLDQCLRSGHAYSGKELTEFINRELELRGEPTITSRTTLMDDLLNIENESFEQSRNKEENEYSVNIPMVYYYKKRLNHGWINIINPFRATIVLGTPGSGKSFGIIDPFIRQHSAKSFAMMVYDYKFPALARNLFYQYCKNRKQGKLPKNCGFRIVNFTDVEYSNRANPIQRKYIPDLAAASETASHTACLSEQGRRR